MRRAINPCRHGTSADDATAIRLAMNLHIVRIDDEVGWPSRPSFAATRCSLRKNAKASE
ncbi:hypothetical protein [Nonomuraea sp. B19D2]|uniref:hypothetical protein n=1 Tax=Nonomuraea sp. B19D2 TaxID=3159561 RepID=UPI0032DA841C